MMNKSNTSSKLVDNPLFTKYSYLLNEDNELGTVDSAIEYFLDYLTNKDTFSITDNKSLYELLTSEFTVTSEVEGEDDSTDELSTEVINPNHKYLTRDHLSSISETDKQLFLLNILDIIKDEELDILVPPFSTNLYNQLLFNKENIMTEDKSVANPKTESEVLAQELEIAKTMLAEQDAKLSKYESLDIDLLLATAEKYESLVTQDAEVITEKSESVCPELAKEINGKVAKLLEDGTEDQGKELNEELDELTSTLVDTIQENTDLKEKLESYEAIGTPSDITGALQEYAKVLMKSESERLASTYGVTPEKATQLIEKLESVTEAEEILADLLPKTESVVDEVGTEKSEAKNEDTTEIVEPSEEVDPKVPSDKELEVEGEPEVVKKTVEEVVDTEAKVDSKMTTEDEVKPKVESASVPEEVVAISSSEAKSKHESNLANLRELALRSK